jgi:mannose-binding lectin 1
LGRPTRLQIQQTSNNFKVTLDDVVCFASGEVKVPLGYSLGISAASSSEPDSFEVFKFVVTTESHTPEIHGGSKDAHRKPEQDEIHAPSFLSQGHPQHPDSQKREENEKWDDLPEVDASKIALNNQFADLHNRLQGVTKHLLTTSRDLVHYQNLAASRHQTILDLLHTLETATAGIHQLQDKLSRFEHVERKVDQIAQDVRATKSDLHNALDQHISGLRLEVRDTHHSVMGTVRSGAVGVGKFVLVVLGSQALTVTAYLLYKRSKNSGGKKYL